MRRPVDTSGGGSDNGRMVADRTHRPLPPGPKIPGLLQTAMFPWRHRVIPRLRAHYGDAFTVSMLGRPAVQLCTPELNKQVFTGSPATFHAGEGNQVLADVMGTHSVLTTDEAEHQRLRRLLMPPFHGSSLRGYTDTITRLAADEARTWSPGIDFAAHPRMNALTLEIIMQVVFGVRDGPRIGDLRDSLHALVTAPMRVMLGEVFPAASRFGPWRDFRCLVHHVDDLIYAEIADRRGAHDVADRADVLSRLISATGGDDDPLTDAELRDQLVTLLLAGHETTATTLAWALHDLARNPEVARRARAATDDGDEHYLDAVVKESMRRRPVIYGVARTLTDDVELGGYRIPAGYTVLPGIGPVHADPALHDAPDEFRPERFLDGTDTSSWLPFGGGNRRCLGANFALLEGRIILSAILSRYDIAPVDAGAERPRARHIVLVPAKGARIRVTRRCSASASVQARPSMRVELPDAGRAFPAPGS